MRRGLPDLVATVVLAVAAGVLWLLSHHDVTVTSPLKDSTAVVTQTVVDDRLLMLATLCAGVAIVCAARAATGVRAGRL